jgi:hypothetical protein
VLLQIRQELLQHASEAVRTFQHQEVSGPLPCLECAEPGKHRAQPLRPIIRGCYTMGHLRVILPIVAGVLYFVPGQISDEKDFTVARERMDQLSSLGSAA